MEIARVLFLMLVLTNFTTINFTSARRLRRATDDDRCRTPDFGVGTCTSIADCKILIDFMANNNNLSDRIKNEIDRYVCFFDGRKFRLCCPSELPAHWTDHSGHKNIKLLPTDNCGLSTTVRQPTNGNVTELNEFPWIAFLKFTNSSHYNCQASLINSRYVLTAANCISPKLISVRIGEYNVTSDVDCVYGSGENICAALPQDFDISLDDVTIHPGYNRSTFENDIALIRLPRDANVNGDSVNSICLPITIEEKSKVFSDYTIITWGRTVADLETEVLFKLSVPLVKNYVCRSIFNTMLINKNHLCAGGEEGKDSCKGDGGGPLSAVFTNPDKRTKTIQYGIISFGLSCGKRNLPAIYTKVSEYVGWILDNIKE